MKAKSRKGLLIAAGLVLAYYHLKGAQGGGHRRRVLIPPGEQPMTRWAPMNGRLVFTR